jgi:hypothetical protein
LEGSNHDFATTEQSRGDHNPFAWQVSDDLTNWFIQRLHHNLKKPKAETEETRNIGSAEGK